MARSDPGRQIKPRSLQQWLLIFAFGILIILIIQIGYAIWVFYAFGEMSTGKTPTDMAPLGQFGDIFGGVNAFFTGAAFAGVIITILLQSSELELQREQLRESTKAQEGSEAALRDQVRLLQESARVSVMATLVDAYTSKIGTTEQGKFRGQLWEANNKIRSSAKKEDGEPPSDEEMARNIGTLIDDYIAKTQDHPKKSDDLDFCDPVSRSSYEAWVKDRQRRDHFLAILEDKFESLR